MRHEPAPTPTQALHEGLEDARYSLADRAIGQLTLEQLEELRAGYARGTGSEEGAEKIEERLGTLTERVLAYFRSKGRGPGARGSTNPELSAALGEKDVTAWPRTTQLQKLGKVVATDERRRNPETGVRCTVYRATTENEEREIFAKKTAEAQAAADPGPLALAAADEVLEAIHAGGLFAGRDYVGRIIQNTINQSRKGKR